MATHSTGRASASGIKRKAHPTFAQKTAKSRKGASKSKEPDPLLDDPPRFFEAHQQFPCSISLNNLIRLDWSRRQELFPQGPGQTRYEQFGFGGRAYAVESLNPETAGDTFVNLLPEAHYCVVPIYEGGQSADAPARLLLIQSQCATDEPRPHIAVVEPPEPSESTQPFAHLHIIGGEDDDAVTEPTLRTAGIAEAILTIIETPPTHALSDARPLSSPLSSPKASFTPDDSAGLRQILAQQFSLDELKNLIFDLGVSSERLPYDTTEQFSRELVRHLETRGELSCLVCEARKYHDDVFLKQLAAKLPHCDPRTKVQIGMEPGVEYNLNEILNGIATSIGINVTDIELLGTATGSLRILISLSQTAADLLIKIEIDGLTFGGNQVVSIFIFTSLDSVSQAAWRFAARKPPTPPTPWNIIVAMLTGEPDPDLLDCIDYFHEIKATYADCAPALAKVQNKFYDYLRRRFGFEVIPIQVGATLFNMRLGHILDESTVLRLAGVGPGIVVRVNKDGFKRGADIRRPALVVVNQPPVTTLRRIQRVRPDRLYVEMDAPKSLPIERLFEEAFSHFRLIDAIYSVLALTLLTSSAELNALAADLRQYSRSSIQLPQLADILDQRLKSAKLVPLRFRYGSRNARLDAPDELPSSFIVIGAAALLDATREIILKQATDQGANNYFVPPDVEWLKARLRRLRRIDDPTRETLALGIAKLLSSFAFAYELRMDQIISTLEFERSGFARSEELTLNFMTSTVRSYLAALETLQRAVDRVRRQAPHTLTISAMQADPIRVSFRGGRDAAAIARDKITPWRRERAKNLARLMFMPARIELLGTGVRPLLRRTRLEFMRTRLELIRAQLEVDYANLAREILAEAGLNLSRLTNEQIRTWVEAIVPAIATVANSELLLSPS